MRFCLFCFLYCSILETIILTHQVVCVCEWVSFKSSYIFLKLLVVLKLTTKHERNNASCYASSLIAILDIYIVIVVVFSLVFLARALALLLLLQI